MISMFVADFDRTITDSRLIVDEECLSRIAELRQKRIHTSVVTGRKKSFMKKVRDEHPGIFDSIICENGCIAFLDDQWIKIAEFEVRDAVMERFLSEEIEFDHGECIISTDHLNGDEVASLLDDIPGWSSIVNINSVMIVPHGVHKGTGISWLQSQRGTSRDETVGIGDGENDVIMRDVCGILGAPASAVESLRNIADFVSVMEYNEGTKDFIEFISARYLSGNMS